ncbi:MAG: hypothetical protein H0V84_10715 [Actinobacteria bacterium]|nr:hypothetical protein [Actinomycetota bacterium]
MTDDAMTLGDEEIKTTGGSAGTMEDTDDGDGDTDTTDADTDDTDGDADSDDA